MLSNDLKKKKKKKSQSIMNNTLMEMICILEGTNNRKTEVKERISEVEDRMVETNEAESKKEKE